MRGAIRKRATRGGHLRQPLGQSHLVLPRHVHGRVPAPLLQRRRHLVGRAVLGRAGRSALSAVRLRLHAGDHPRARRQRSGFSRRRTASRAFRRRSRSSSAAWRACPGASSRSSSSRPAARSTSSCTSRTSRPARSGSRSRRPIPYLGIVASEQTRTLYAQGALPVYFSHTLGAFKAFLEKHVPVRVLTEHDLEDADLQGVRVLVLPNVACLSPRAAEVVRRFVKAGGGLVATFETSLYDEHYQKRSDFALADLFHAQYHRHDHGHPADREPVPDARRRRHPIVDDPVIKAKQNTAWLNPGNPPAKGPLALIASADEGEAARRRPGAGDLQRQPAAGRSRERASGDHRVGVRQGTRRVLPGVGRQGDVLLPRRLHAADAASRRPLGSPRRDAAGRGRGAADPDGHVPPPAGAASARSSTC